MSNKPAMSVFFPAGVRECVIEQHQNLRQLLQRSKDAIRQPAGADRDRLCRLVYEVRSRFRHHLAFEEHNLAPVLAHLDLWGPVRVQELFTEHARQRARMDLVIEGIEEGWAVEHIALALSGLITHLLQDMEEEERGCVSATLLQDEMIIVGTTGD